MTDMYRQPDKLLKALDVIADVTIKSVLSDPGIINTLLVNYPLHKGGRWLDCPGHNLRNSIGHLYGR